MTAPAENGQEAPCFVIQGIFALMCTYDFNLTHPRRVVAALFVKKHLSKTKVRYGDVRMVIHAPKTR